MIFFIYLFFFLRFLSMHRHCQWRACLVSWRIVVIQSREPLLFSVGDRSSTVVRLCCGRLRGVFTSTVFLSDSEESMSGRFQAPLSLN